MVHEEDSESRPSRGAIPPDSPLSLEEIEQIKNKKLGLRSTNPSQLQKQKANGFRGTFITIWNTASFVDLAKGYNNGIDDVVGMSLGILLTDGEPYPGADKEDGRDGEHLIKWHEYRNEMTLEDYLSKRFPNDLPATEIIEDVRQGEYEPINPKDHYGFGKSLEYRVKPENILATTELSEGDIALIRERYKDDLGKAIGGREPENLELKVLLDLEVILRNELLRAIRQVISASSS